MCLPLTSCCFCVKLDVGAKIISIINLVFSVAIAMLYGTAAMMPSYVAETRKIVYAIVANVAMFEIIIGSLLIYGVFGKKPRLILPWLITSWVFCVSLLALSIFGTILIVLKYTRDQETTSEVSTMSSVYCLYALTLYYFAAVVNSRREEMLFDDHTESSQGLMRREFGIKFPI
ncbi:uncharacterized protein LOC125068758 [Vanessa atalanta]|uniref:uncharacterized protein LOC125068758 n=1 Tax=Vanessa atalanta TaxID=42275 RepID=UPI001FCCC1E7|nr:uncharacterized protein LOC125068758 [Vanessa atalanta]